MVIFESKENKKYKKWKTLFSALSINEGIIKLMSLYDDSFIYRLTINGYSYPVELYRLFNILIYLKNEKQKISDWERLEKYVFSMSNSENPNEKEEFILFSEYIKNEKNIFSMVKSWREENLNGLPNSCIQIRTLENMLWETVLETDNKLVACDFVRQAGYNDKRQIRFIEGGEILTNKEIKSNFTECQHSAVVCDECIINAENPFYELENLRDEAKSFSLADEAKLYEYLENSAKHKTISIYFLENIRKGKLICCYCSNQYDSSHIVENSHGYCEKCETMTLGKIVEADPRQQNLFEK